MRIVLSEITPYRNGDILRRSRLDVLLDRGSRNAAMFLVAPEGFGKTTALKLYRLHLGSPMVFFTPDETDRTAEAFWARMAAAFSQDMPRAAQAFDRGFPAALAARERFFQKLTELLEPGKRLLFVIDQYERVESEEVREFLGKFVNRMGGAVCTVFSMRSRMGRLPASIENSHACLCVTGKDLEFDLSEIQSLTAKRGCRWERAEAEALLRYTGGWPLAVDSILRRHTVFHKQAVECIPEYIALLFCKKYFVHYPRPVRRLLTGLSVVSAFAPDLVEALKGEIPAEGMDFLTENGFITYDLLEKRFWIHPMYRAFLAEKQGFLGDAEIKRIHLLAGRSAEKNGFLREAVWHYWKCRQYERMMRALTSAFRAPLDRPDAERFLSVLSKMPAAYVETSVLVLFCRAYLHFCCMNLDYAEREMRRVARRIERQTGGGANRALLGEAYIVIADICRIRGKSIFHRYYAKAAAQLPEGSGIFSGAFHVAGNNDVFFAPENVYNIEVFVKKVFDKAPAAERALHGRGYGFEYLFAAEAAFYQGEQEKAAELAEFVLRKGAERGQSDILMNAHLLLLRLALLCGRYAEAIRQFEKMREIAAETTDAIAHVIEDSARGILDLYLEEDTQIQGILDYDAGLIRRWPWALGRTQLLETVALLCRGRCDQAVANCRWLQRSIGGERLWSVRLPLHIIDAICCYRTKDLPGAAAALQQAYDMAYPRGLCTPFVEYGGKMAELLFELLESGDSRFDAE
ncbi:AAA family ATPase, partial [Oscillospiraceae bacterium OttesenSCG-928-F05]|nr:AAA family ATPase [Oscillospiraceae bacterium OttesenSCG-928-F05]